MAVGWASKESKQKTMVGIPKTITLCCTFTVSVIPWLVIWGKYQCDQKINQIPAWGSASPKFFHSIISHSSYSWGVKNFHPQPFSLDNDWRNDSVLSIAFPFVLPNISSNRATLGELTVLKWKLHGLHQLLESWDHGACQAVCLRPRDEVLFLRKNQGCEGRDEVTLGCGMGSEPRISLCSESRELRAGSEAGADLTCVLGLFLTVITKISSVVERKYEPTCLSQRAQ